MKAFNLLLRLASAYGMTFRCATGTALFAVATSPVSTEAGIRHSPRNRWNIEHTAAFLFLLKERIPGRCFLSVAWPWVGQYGKQGDTDECAKSCQLSCPRIWNPFLIVYVGVLRPQLASRILKTFSSQLGISVGERVPLFYCLIVRLKIILSIGSASPSRGHLVTFHIPKPWALISHIHHICHPSSH